MRVDIDKMAHRELASKGVLLETLKLKGIDITKPITSHEMKDVHNCITYFGEPIKREVQCQQ